MSKKWDGRFLDLAAEISSWSRDPSTQVGAVIVRPDRTIASLGYNGFPRGVGDSQERYNDRPTKYMMVVHAEANAIVTAQESLSGHTIYVNPMHPCADCTGLIIQAGIRRVVSPRVQIREDWARSFELSMIMCEEAGVDWTTYEMENA